MKLKKKLQFGMKLELSDQTLQRPFFFFPQKNSVRALEIAHNFFFCPSVLSMCAWNMRSRPTDVVLHLLGDGMDGLSQAATEGARNKTERGGGSAQMEKQWMG